MAAIRADCGPTAIASRLEQNRHIQHRPVIVHQIVMLDGLSPVDKELVIVQETTGQFGLRAGKRGNRGPGSPPTDGDDLRQPVPDGPDEKLMPKISIRPGKRPGCIGPQMVKESAGVEVRTRPVHCLMIT